eukprot:scaffold94569_cov40-Prasinocladus_malaysianus.AAC.2
MIGCSRRQKRSRISAKEAVTIGSDGQALRWPSRRDDERKEGLEGSQATPSRACLPKTAKGTRSVATVAASRIFRLALLIVSV